jgi:hypothetical protein
MSQKYPATRKGCKKKRQIKINASFKLRKIVDKEEKIYNL